MSVPSMMGNTGEARHQIRVERTDRDLLVSMCQLLTESLMVQQHMLSELREIRAALAADDRKDSFEFDSNGSAGKVKVKAKRYAASIDEARALSELEFVRGMAWLEEAQEKGWRATLAKLEGTQQA